MCRLGQNDFLLFINIVSSGYMNIDEEFCLMLIALSCYFNIDSFMLHIISLTVKTCHIERIRIRACKLNIQLKWALYQYILSLGKVSF